MKRRKRFIFWFALPTLLVLLFVYMYPTVRTFLMSFYSVRSVTDNFSQWTFIGFDNFKSLTTATVFHRSLLNILKIWIFGGVIVLALALFFSVALTSGIKGKRFWRALLYMPNVISAVALCTMWVHYVFNNQYGLLHTLFTDLGWDKMASFQWTTQEHLLLSMMIAVVYACVGYYVLILTAGIDGIPRDYYEAASMEGCGIFRKTIYITFPLLHDVIKRVVVLWSAFSIGFFAYSKLFSMTTEMATVTPIVYMYDKVFVNQQGTGAELNTGVGAAVSVVVMLMVLLVNSVLNLIMKDKK